MELTPQQFIEAEFSEVRRGFDRDEVDAFLVKAAKGVEAMQKRITELETQMAARPPEAPTDEMIARTLKLAQRTADDVVAEAQRDAEVTRATATSEATAARTEAAREASRTLDDAHVRAAEVLAAAEAEAKASTDDLRSRLRAEVVALEETRNRLRAEITGLEGHVAARRESLLETAEQLRALTQDRLAEVAVPAAGVVALPGETAPLTVQVPFRSEPDLGHVPDLDQVPDLQLEAGPSAAVTIASVLAPPTVVSTTVDAPPHPASTGGTDHAPPWGSSPVSDRAGGTGASTDDEPEIPIIDPDPTPSSGVAAVVGNEELATSFFEGGESFRDERWKPRRERNR